MPFLDWSKVDKKAKPVSARQGAVAKLCNKCIVPLTTRNHLFDIFDPCFKPIGVEIITLGGSRCADGTLLRTGERYDVRACVRVYPG